MSRSKLNFIIDAILMLIMAAIAGIGFMMKWVLISGKQQDVVYGRRGNGDQDTAGRKRTERIRA